jgi:hypothetical protein
MNHFYDKLEGWFDFEAVYYRIAREIPPGAAIAEVGCYKGKSIAYLAVEILNRALWDPEFSKALPRFYCIDTWANRGYDMYPEFTKSLWPVASLITPVQMPSCAASLLFPDGGLDFVFIDACHDYEYIYHDIKAWFPKIKKGGYIGGHDYDNAGVPGVRKSVDEFFPNAEKIGISWLWKKP